MENIFGGSPISRRESDVSRAPDVDFFDNSGPSLVGGPILGGAQVTTPVFSTNDYTKLFISEFVASFFFYFIVSVTAAVGATALGINLAHAFILAIVISVFWSQNAGHINPAVTLAFCLLDAVGFNFMPGNRWISFTIYIAAQTAGAVLGTLVTWGVMGDRSTGLGAPSLVMGFSQSSGFLFEVVGSLILHSVILWIVGLRLYYEGKLTRTIVKGKETQQPRPPKPWPIWQQSDNPALIIGLTMGTVNIPGIFITGGAFNWYRQFWPALIAGTLSSTDWIYPIGSFTGAIVSTVVAWFYFRTFYT